MGLCIGENKNGETTKKGFTFTDLYNKIGVERVIIIMLCYYMRVIMAVARSYFTDAEVGIVFHSILTNRYALHNRRNHISIDDDWSAHESSLMIGTLCPMSKDYSCEVCEKMFPENKTNKCPCEVFSDAYILSRMARLFPELYIANNVKPDVKKVFQERLKRKLDCGF